MENKNNNLGAFALLGGALAGVLSFSIAALVIRTLFSLGGLDLNYFLVLGGVFSLWVVKHI